MDFRVLRLVATVIDCCGRPHSGGPGHPPAETIRVVATKARMAICYKGTAWRWTEAKKGSLSRTEDGHNTRWRASDGAQRSSPETSVPCT